MRVRTVVSKNSHFYLKEDYKLQKELWYTASNKYKQWTYIIQNNPGFGGNFYE